MQLRDINMPRAESATWHAAFLNGCRALRRPVLISNCEMAEESARHIATIQNLATKHALTSYDAAYLELTLRLGCPLLSSDGPLCAAARAEGVTLLGLADTAAE